VLEAVARGLDAVIVNPAIVLGPRDVNFAGWVGDQDPTWIGLDAALTNMFFSGLRGFVNFGSDIGAYRDDGMRDEEVFTRWVQLGAMSPVIQPGPCFPRPRIGYSTPRRNWSVAIVCSMAPTSVACSITI